MKKYYYLIFILAITILAYIPAFHAELLQWDDAPFIINNNYIKNLSFANIKYIFTNSIEGYHPLSLLTLAIEYHFVGLSPFLYHFDNILLHLINITLLYFIIFKLTKNYKISIIVAILFAINPVHVQTVAQASERRGLLMAMFYFISLFYYINYCIKNNRKSYYISLLFFILSLFSNGRAIPLSISIILIDYLLNRNILEKKIIFEKLPFIALAVIFGIISIYTQKLTGYAYKPENFTYIDYFFIAGYNYIQYIINLLLPFNLSSGYPYPTKINGLLPFQYYIYTLLSIVIFILLLYSIKKKKLKNKLIIFGILFYTINIVLLLRLFSPLTENIMEDHYSYIPSVGIFLIFAFFLNSFIKKYQTVKKLIYSFSFVIISILIVLTYQRNIVWQNTMSLLNNILQKQPNRFVPLNNRGYLFLYSDKYTKALTDFNKAIKIKPDYIEPYYGRARVYQELGQTKNALLDYNKFIESCKEKPTNFIQLSAAYNNRGVIRAHNRKYKEAYEDFYNSIRLNPNFCDPLTNLALIYLIYDNTQKAIALCNKAIKINPKYEEAYNIKKMAIEKEKK